MARKPTGSSRRGSLPTTDDGATPPAKVQKTAAAGSLRRSARSSAVMASYVDDADQPTETETSESDMKPASDAADNPEAGVQKAIKGLVRMEKQLMRAVKKQKIEIQKSKVPIRKDDIGENAFKPRPTKNMDEDMISNAPDNNKRKRAPAVKKEVESDYEDNLGSPGDQDVDEGVPGSGEFVDKGAGRPPPVNSDYLPLPWKGRLGYACLNTYLRNAKPPIFSSRTCRMSSIIDHRHPLQDPSQPPHPTKNRPDKTKKADEALGRKFVQDLGIANARDIAKMIRWNERYGIRFMRLSSEMFPFASHDVHGYKLAPFASEVLAEAGQVIAELGHRVTMHPGQFTQLGSPRKEVIVAAVRDLEYHDELLTLLRLPPQQDRDAVLILHMGGVYGDKASALERFKQSYNTLLSPSIKNRLVLENDDVSWSVHDLLPVCEELNIPLVLDWHHHNIVFDAEHLREGTLDISAPELQERIRRTWTRKNITQKQHYSEPEPGAVTARDRRKHSPRVATLPPCFADMDLMIEAKDKEQAVFELMRNFRLPGFERANMVIPYEREDEDKPLPRGGAKKNGTPKKNGKAKKRKIDAKGAQEILLHAGDDGVPGGMVETAGPDGEVEQFPAGPPASTTIPPEELSMGGPLGRVYWPPGMEDWLRPKKREVKEKVKKEEDVIENEME